MIMKQNAVSSPEWFRKGVVYQINLRTFSEEGTINSVIPELSFLKDLGFNIIYLCPIYESDCSTDKKYWSERQKKYETNNPKNPYRMKNYFKIDSEYGSLDDLQNLVKEAHKLGMKVLLDLVYLHMGPSADILKTHPEFAIQDEEGNILQNRYNFPGLNFECKGLCEYLWSNMVYWMIEGDVDGFRCDVPDDIPNDFWIEGRRRIQTIKPDAILINEGQNVKRLVDSFDGCYAIRWGSNLHKMMCGIMSMAELKQGYDEVAENTPMGGVMVRYLDTHDNVTNWPGRCEINYGHDGMEVAQVLNYVLDGVPMVYAGNELADSADVNMFANRFYMGKYEVTNRNDKYSLASVRRQGIYQKLNRLCKECEVLSKGTMKWIENSQPEQVISFVREYDGKKVVFVGELTGKKTEAVLEADWKLKKEFMRHNCEVQDCTISLEAYGYIVMEI